MFKLDGISVMHRQLVLRFLYAATYRVPIGDEALTLTLLKEGSTWKIDTSKSVRVPLEFFFRGR